MIADTTRTNRAARELCTRLVDYDPALLPPVADTAVEMKHDGIRAVWRRRLGVRTMEGVDMDTAAHLLPGLEAIADEMGVDMLDGEYLNPAGFEATLADFQRGRGMGVMLLWDGVTSAVYDGREPSPPLRARRAALETAYARVRAAGRHCGVGLSRLASGYDAERVELAAGEAWRDDWEGIVIKDLRSGYERARTSSWMRLKRTLTCEVRVLSIELRPGTALLRAVLASYEGREVRIATGFSEAERRRPGDFTPGSLIEVKHLGVTSSGRLRSATFLRIRGDRA